MYNNRYLQDIRTNITLPTPAENILYLFKKDLTEKDKIWLIFEDELFVKKKELVDVPFEENLRNILFVSNLNMTNQIIKVLYENEYDPFKDYINLEWFNTEQQKYLLKTKKILNEIKSDKDNVLIGCDIFSAFRISEFDSKDINVKDLFFLYGIDILFTFEPNDTINKIYFNNESLSIPHIQYLLNKISKVYKCNFIPESVSIEIDDKDLNAKDIFNVINEVNFELPKQHKYEKNYKGDKNEK